MKKVIVFGLALLFGQAVAAAGNSVLPTDSSVIGVINGKEVTLGELQNKEISEIRRVLFNRLENAFIAEAINRFKTSDKSFADIPLPPMKEEEVRKFFNDNDLSKRGSYEQLAPQIRQYLKDRFRAGIELNLYHQATKEGKAKSNLVDPGAYLVTIPLETAYIQGAKNATVMMLEFSDFQCPYCKKVQPTLQQLVKTYGDRVAFGYRHFPLAFHQEADESAIAAECAREQGKFIEMHQMLYQQQSKQSIGDLQDLAKKIGVADTDKFDACLKTEKYRPLLERDMEVAESVGITGTPAFIIGKYDSSKGVVVGELLTGAQPEDIFAKTLEKYLAK